MTEDVVHVLTPEQQDQAHAQLRKGNSFMLEVARGRNYVNLFKQQARYACDELFQREKFRGEIYDCWRRNNGIVEAALHNGNPTFTTSVDFLGYAHRVTNIVAEPPMHLAEAIARHGLSLITGKLALLLPVIWMTTPAVKQLFDETPIARIYLLTQRLRYRKGPMAWYVFERGHIEAPQIRWI